MSIDPAVVRAALDHLIAAAVEIRDALLRAKLAAAKERRLVQRAELAALRDLAADGGAPESEDSHA